MVEPLECRTLMSVTGVTDFAPPTAGGAARDDFTGTVGATGRMAARNGTIRVRVVFQSPQPIDRSTFDGDEVVVTGPGGTVLPVELTSLRGRRDGTRLVAAYRAAAPAAGETGEATYALRLTEAAANGAGLGAEQVELGAFHVAAGARVARLSAPAPEAPPEPASPAPLPSDDYVQPPSDQEYDRPLPPPDPAQHPQGAEALLRAAARLRVGVDQLTIELMEGVVWADGSLGGAVPGDGFTLALEPGYRIIVSGADRRRLEYHTAAREGTPADVLRQRVYLYGRPDTARTHDAVG